ncbi:MAG: hypothetical protein RL660_371 [Bacteroidota bacterium]|jgi:LemA protein
MRNVLIVVAILAILGFWLKNGYNGFVTADENVKKAWADVQGQYQRRYDLIDGLVNTAKGVSKFEQNTLTAVVEARAKATQVMVDPANLTPEKFEEFKAANNNLSGALGRLMMISEQYPEIKSTKAYENLQVELSGTENRVARSREMFNEAVQLYNTSIRKFPANLIAGMTGFKQRTGFEAENTAQKAPKVDFSEEKK